MTEDQVAGDQVADVQVGDDKTKWLTSEPLRKFLAARRDNDVKVLVNNIGVPITAVAYNSTGDQYEIELYDGEDLKTALVDDGGEALRTDLRESEDLRQRLAEKLDAIAVAIKGKPGPLQMHSWHDLPKLAQQLRVERDWLLAEADDSTRARFRRLASSSTE